MFNLFRKKVRVRFAPSPTGFVHIGSLLTVLFDYLFARHHRGTFVLRIEDTDQKREVEGSVENILKVLKWAGLEPDEGIFLNSEGKAASRGKYGPYTQSERLPIYQKYAQKLIEAGAAYYCFCSAERLEEVRAEQEARKELTHYDRHCRDLSREEAEKKIKNGAPHVIRQKVPADGEIILNDLIRGEVKFPLDSVDDSVLLKSDGFPTYHLAVVVDDYLMKITHVIRGQEWLPSTPKHLLLYKSFGWAPPQFAHMSHLLNKDRTKLSKRKGDVAVEDYIRKGYLPEALINFLVTTGWNEGEGSEQELYSTAELIKKFDLGKVHRTGAIFDVDKLDWFNGMYIRKLSPEKLVELARPYLEEAGYKVADEKLLQKVVLLEQERIKKLSDLPELVKFVFAEKLDYDPALLVWKKSTADQTKNILIDLEKFFAEINDWSKENLEKKIMAWVVNRGLTNGEVLWPMRVALTGEKNSPGPFEVAEVLGKDKSLMRIKEAIEIM